MRINQHIPYNARNDLASPFAQLHFQLTERLQAIPGVVLTVSSRPIRAHEVARGAFAINYHTRYRRAGNLNLKLNYLPGYLYADRCGFSGWSEVADLRFDPATVDAAEAEHFLSRRIEARIFARGMTKMQQTRTGASRTLPEGYVLFPLQVPRDVVLQLADLDADAILPVLVAHARRQPVVIKLHPGTRDAGFAERIRALHDPARGVHVVDDHIHDLIARAALVVTVNSGTGFEALLFGRPVLSCGRSDYHHLTTRVSSLAELAAALDRPPPAPDRSTLARYALWYSSQMIDLAEPGWEDRIIARLRATRVAASGASG
jgi:Capsule polysaccharide biosynthesis protein